MANCTICGKWAGLFSKNHQLCKDANDIRLSEFNTIAMLPVENSSNSVPSISVSFGMHSEYLFGTEHHKLIKSALAQMGIQSAQDEHSVAIAVSRLINEGRTAREFANWCRSEEAPLHIRAVNSAWYEILYDSLSSLSFALRQRDQIFSPSMEIVFPYLKIDSYGCRVPLHKQMDGFVALRSDPVWKTFSLPYDWCCSCIVLSLMEEEEEIGAEAKLDGLSRLPRGILARSHCWQQMPPNKTLMR